MPSYSQAQIGVGRKEETGAVEYKTDQGKMRKTSRRRRRRRRRRGSTKEGRKKQQE